MRYSIPILIVLGLLLFSCEGEQKTKQKTRKEKIIVVGSGSNKIGEDDTGSAQFYHTRRKTMSVHAFYMDSTESTSMARESDIELR